MWSVRICGMAVGTKLQSYLRKSISGAELFEYWVGGKKRIAGEVMQNIDWEANSKSMMSGLARQHWVAKFMSGWCATGAMMTRWDKSLVAMYQDVVNKVRILITS